MSIRDKNELFELLNCCDMEKLGKNFGLYSKYNPTFFLGLGGLGAWTCLQSQVCFLGPSTPVFPAL